MSGKSWCHLCKVPHGHLCREDARERDRIAKLEADVESWRDASGLVGVHANGCEGDPGDVEPHHLAAHLAKLEAELEQFEHLHHVARDLWVLMCASEHPHPDSRVRRSLSIYGNVLARHREVND